MTPAPHDGYRSRKFWLVVAIIGLNFFLMMTGKIEPEHWVEILGWVFSAFVLANVGEKFKDSIQIGKRGT